MPRRKGGLFLPLDVGFMADDKVLDAGERAGWLYIAMSLFCKGAHADGVMTRAQVEKLGIVGWQNRLADLTRPLGIDQQPLVIDNGNGTYVVRAYLNHNDPVAEVDERRRKDAARKHHSERNPNGIRTESERPSEPSRDVEQNRTEQNEGKNSTSVSDHPLPPQRDVTKIEILRIALQTHYRRPYSLDDAQRTADLVLGGRDVADPTQYVLAAVRADPNRFKPALDAIPETPIPPRRLSPDELDAAAAAARQAREALTEAKKARTA